MGLRPGGERYCRCGTRLALDNPGRQCARCQRASREKLIAPPQVPAGFWESDRLRDAFAAQHMGRVARAYREHPHHWPVYGDGGISQRLLGEWLGLSQGQVSRIENGPPIRNLDVLAYWARMLRIPPDLLWFDLPGSSRRISALNGKVLPAGEGMPEAQGEEDLFTASTVGADGMPPSGTSVERRPSLSLPRSATRALLAETLGVELVDLARAMQASNVSAEVLQRMETAVLRFHKVYAQLPPIELLPHVHEHLRAVTSLLQRSQPIKYRRRLCSIAGHLAGLRAWLTFDLGDQKAAHDWYEIALQPAEEADDLALCAWILGARSLIPWYNADLVGALDLVRRAQSYAHWSGNITAKAWLAALEARAHAGMGDGAAFRHAQDQANGAIDGTRFEDRRHGMDFHDGRLNVAYYEGTSLVALNHPEGARPVLSEALAVQGQGHLKARSIVLLTLATAHVQQGQIEEACMLGEQALDLPSEQRIGPIDQRAHDLMHELEPWCSDPAVATFRNRLTTR